MNNKAGKATKRSAESSSVPHSSGTSVAKINCRGLEGFENAGKVTTSSRESTRQDKKANRLDNKKENQQPSFLVGSSQDIGDQVNLVFICCLRPSGYPFLIDTI